MGMAESPHARETNQKSHSGLFGHRQTDDWDDEDPDAYGPQDSAEPSKRSIQPAFAQENFEETDQTEDNGPHVPKRQAGHAARRPVARGPVSPPTPPLYVSDSCLRSLP